jgi:hypothetical protein
MQVTTAAEYPITDITVYPAEGDSEHPAGPALALLPSPGGAVSPLRSADDVAAAFLAGYGPATRGRFVRWRRRPSRGCAPGSVRAMRP